MDTWNVTVGEFVARLKAKGRSDPVVGEWIQSAARSAARVIGVRRRFPCVDEEDLVAEAVVVALTRRSIRKFRKDVLLAAWAGGVIKKHALQKIRSERRRRGPTKRPGRRRRRQRLSASELARRLRSLTVVEREALAAWRRGLKQRNAAREIGISRDAYKKRSRRARRWIESGTRPRIRVCDRAWAASEALARSKIHDDVNAAILAHHFLGWKSADIALLVRKSPEAVRQALSRLRRERASHDFGC